MTEIKLLLYPLIIDANPIPLLMCFMKLFDNNMRLYVLSIEVLCFCELLTILLCSHWLM